LDQVVPTQPRGDGHGVAKARDREQFRDALQEPDDDGPEVGEQRHLQLESRLPGSSVRPEGVDPSSPRESAGRSRSATGAPLTVTNATFTGVASRRGMAPAHLP